MPGRGFRTTTEKGRNGMQPIGRPVQTSGAPAAIGPYSQAIAVREIGLVFTSGQIGLDPGSGELAPGGVEAEFRQVLANLGAVLEASGSALNRILKSTLFLVDLSDFGAVNALYAERIGAPLPARSTVGVASLPRGARVEMDVIAALREAAGEGTSPH
jgi:2-iminobutanoate/2-iminopropanoate deaminase